MSIPNSRAGTAAVALASIIWGASFFLAKIAFRELPVGDVILGRFLFAALPLIPVLWLHPEHLDPEDVPLFALTGFLMVPVTIFLQFGGLSLTSASSAALIVGTGTPLLAVAGVLFERERLSLRGWTAVALSTLGVALLVGPPGGRASFVGDVLVLASILVSVIWILTSKRLTGRYSAFFATGWIIVYGTAFLFPIVLVWDGVPTLQLSGVTWLSLAGLGLGCTVLAYTLWNWGVSRIGAARSAIWLNFEPMAGALFGVALLGETLTGGVAVGGLLILAAATMIAAPPRLPLTERSLDKARWVARAAPVGLERMLM